MAQAKRFRKTIRINGRSITRRFVTRAAANAWYNKQYDRKRLDDAGVVLSSDDGMLFKDFAVNEFLVKRKKEYPRATWASDEQRLKAYLLPKLGSMPMHKITSLQIRSLLANLTTQGGLSAKTRDRVRALVSAIFNEALNREDGPLVANNPTFGLKFKSGKRMGSKDISYLESNADGAKYLKAAAELSSEHLVIGGLGLNGGLRKQEMIPLRWARVHKDTGNLEVAEKFEQASGEILKGTKGGENKTRFVPMSDALSLILANHKSKSKFNKPQDFVLCGRKGEHLTPKQIYRMHMETCKRAGVKATVHGLRHTFGREFITATGDLNALKEILGHTNIAVTQIYSTLGKERLRKYRGVVSFSDLHRQGETDADTE